VAKRVVSVSLGSSRRDSVAEVEVLGEKVVLERRGTDGDFQGAICLIRELDGKVDAIGLGGIDLYLVAGGRRYAIRDAQKLKEAAKKTPVVDGSGLKHTRNAGPCTSSPPSLTGREPRCSFPPPWTASAWPRP
jgi:hypothetical protein